MHAICSCQKLARCAINGMEVAESLEIGSVWRID